MRCFGDGDPLYERYHDDEWGHPVVDERGLFERLCLEGFQSGISWLIVLRKRDSIRAAFLDFDPDKVSRFDDDDVLRLLEDPGIIRNRAKVGAAITNARATIGLRSSRAPLPDLVWSYRPDDRPAPKSFSDMPSVTEESKALARELKRAGFKFVGPTTVYATMQACGVVNDHLAGCSARKEVERARAAVP